MKKQQIAIIGCGDYVLRWESHPISASKNIVVKSLYDLDAHKAGMLACKIGGEIVNSENAIFEDAEIDIVCIFVPPWSRRPLIQKAADAKKHIITTKPLAPSVNECAAIIETVKNKVRCGVFYGRTGNACAEAYKNLFESEVIGKLALYKQDWIHHYPTWNDWATDRDKNGGPFMDAMIHNLNLTRYLMARNIEKARFFSDNLVHPSLKCNDTEFLKVDFENNGSAHLFITWAADLEIFDPKGNDREHIDIFYMVSDQGWHITQQTRDNKQVIQASKEGKIKTWSVQELEMTPYDAFALSVFEDTPFRRDIVSLKDAYEDIYIIKNAEIV